MRTALIKTGQGQPRHTSRASKEQQLIPDQEANLLALVEHIDGLVWSVDRNMQYIILNSALRKKIKDLIGVDASPGDKMLDLLALLDPTKKGEWEKIYEHALKGKSQRLLQKFILKDKPAFFDISINPIRNGNEITGLSCFALDVTEKITYDARLKASEAHFRTLIENSTDIIAVLNKEGEVIYGSPSIENQFGVSPQQYLNANVFHFIAEEDRAHAMEKFQEALKRPGKPLPVQTRTLRPDGSIGYVEGLVTNLLAKPEIQGIVCNFRDVTERVMAEEAQKQVDLKFRALIENSADLIMMANAMGQFTYGSPSVKKLLGWSGKDYLNKNVFCFIHPDSIPDATQLLGGLMQQPGKSFTIYLTLLHRNGKSVQVEGIATNFLHVPGINALVANFRDITERKKAQKRIHESENLYRDLFNKSPLPICVCDAISLKFLEANDAAVKHYGYSRKEFMNLSAPDLCMTDGLEELRALLHSGRKSTNQRLLRKQARKNGEIVYAEVISHMIIYKGRESFMILANDITEKVKLRHELMEEKIYRQKEIMKASIDAQEKEREEIGREMHDNVTQILTTARLCLSLAADDKEPKILINRSSDIIAAAIEEIRKLSKDLTQSYHRDVGLQLSLEDLTDSIRIASQLQVDFQFAIDDEYQLDDKLKMTIFRIAQEQLNNVLKHAKASSVSVSVVQEGDTITLTVEDDGKGFSMQEKRNGIGLLNIINRADLFNGRVKIDSAPGTGCRMTITFKPMSQLRPDFSGLSHVQ
ncbi:PAS domain S-box protein [Pseudobacter ginsenosidimutans]|uniref:histidine kinase n=1 Tax=Pseudobacter ginsenosidimutans TaxID=661488 RepID=A0A4Q7MSU7_9BACT|nr:PAS domain S-box protein [Pseudobacter ginsenosidimutans]QEC41323.1 PAS domain S-box protein [Pseudobacter ginsenosidimutans]RZS71902.1 PAS domain S-box-containing protein [Pseudobacter ginsenosidimutans]